MPGGGSLLDVRSIREAQLPCILLLGFSHYNPCGGTIVHLFFFSYSRNLRVHVPPAYMECKLICCTSFSREKEKQEGGEAIERGGLFMAQLAPSLH